MGKDKFEQGLVSIIVPVYNVKDYLRQCLDSLLGQTYTHLEIIIVDNGSTDGSGDICEDYVQQDTRCKVIHRPHGYVVSFPRNTGLSEARGEYCFFVDSDDWLEPDAVENCVLAFENNLGVNVVSFNVHCWKLLEEQDLWERTSPFFWYREEVLSQETELLDAFIMNKLLPAPWQRAYRTEVIKDLRFIEKEGIVEDGPFLLELCLQEALKMLTLPKACYNYRLFRPGALTNKLAYIWNGTIIGFREIFSNSKFRDLPIMLRQKSMLLVARYLRGYLCEFYSEELQIRLSEENKAILYEIMEAYQKLLEEYKTYLPLSIDGCMARLMLNCPLERILLRHIWFERGIRLLHIKSLLYPL